MRYPVGDAPDSEVCRGLFRRYVEHGDKLTEGYVERRSMEKLKFGRILETVGDFTLSGWVTFSLVIVICATFITELFVIANDASSLELFVVSPGFSPSVGWILGLLGHKSLDHMITNLALLAVYGVQVERVISGRRLLLLFFGVGLLSALIHTNLTGNNAIGASGAALGVSTFWSVAHFFGNLSETTTDDNLGRTTAIAAPIIVLITAVADFFFISGTGGIAHASGGVLGALAGLYWVSTDRYGS